MSESGRGHWSIIELYFYEGLFAMGKKALKRKG